MSDDRKRNFVRVDAELLISFKKLEKKPLIWQQTSTAYLTNIPVNIAYFKESSEKEDFFKLIYSALGKISDDLRLIKEKLGINECSLQKKEINISGGGISFMDSEKFCKDDFLESSLVLPLEIPVMIKAILKIVNEPLFCSTKNIFEYQAAFELIDDDDRELIVKYTFKRQRELINQNKNRN